MNLREFHMLAHWKAWLVSLLKTHQFALLLALTFISFSFSETISDLFYYQRNNVEHGQYWRLITANFVHLNWGHTWLNLTGVLLWTCVFSHHDRLVCLVMISFVMAAGIGTLIHFFSTSIDFYFGFSGAIHGLIFYSILSAPKKDWLMWAVAILLVGKLLYEQSPFYQPGISGQLIEHNVVVDAHLYGALMGMLIGCVKRMPIMFKR